MILGLSDSGQKLPVVVSNSYGRQNQAVGAVSAYRAVQAAGIRPSLNLLWALEGALSDRDLRLVSREERTALLMQLDDAKR
jgi:DNA transformation protein